MTRSTRILWAFPWAAAAVLAACAQDTTAPGRTAAAPQFAMAAGADSYIVAFKGNGVPADFAAQVAALGGTVTSLHAGAGLAAVSGLSDAAAAQLSAAKDVSEVQPDALISLDVRLAAADGGTADDAVASQSNPATAARYSWQWNMRLIRANTAWAAGKLGSAGVTVAILDTGIDYDDPDLNGLVDLSRSASFIASDDSLTTTYFPTRNLISDYHGHGTNVASQVSSKAIALAGVTSKTTLIGVKVLSARGSGPLSAILNGVLWAADHGADVANMSLGGGFAKAGNGRYVGLINRTFTYAARQGMLVVVAAGNDAADLDHDGNALPTYCGVPTVVCVSAVGPATATGNPDAFAYYSNFGRSAISVAGPGGNADAANGFTVSAWPWGNDIASWVWSYCSKTRLVFAANGIPSLTVCSFGNRLTGYIGTSQATPHVAGLAALVIAETGKGNPSQVKARIQQSANDLGQPGTDPFYGRGRINVARALGL